MSEGIWIGGHYTDDNERQQIEQEYQSRQGGYQQPEQQGYYSGPMPDADQPQQPEVVQQEPEPEPQPSTAYLANPENFAEVWQKFDQDPNYEDEHYSRQQIDTLYDHYNWVNQGASMDQWKPLMDNDEFVTKEIIGHDWYDPNKEAAIQQAATQNEYYNPEDPTKQAFFEQKEMGDWNDLDWIGKAFTAVTVNDEGLGNMPDWTKKSQAAAQALSSAMAGPATLKIAGGIASALGAGGAAAALANPIVLVGAGLAVGGLTFYQAYTGKEIPVFSKFLELSDLADTVTEHVLGYGAQAIDIARTNFKAANADKNDSYGLMAAISDTLKDIGRQSSAMWETGEYFYEMEGSIGDFAIDALKEIFKGEKGTEQGEAWMFNRGINEKQQMTEGTYGLEGMRNIREMYQEMDELGIDKDLQKSLMQQAVINATGTSGNVSDYTAQMLLDVDILTTPIENEAAGLVSRAVGDQNGIKATEFNRGDMAAQLPFVGNIIQAIRNSQGETAAKTPGGIMEWIDTRKDLARSTDVNQLSAADRFFGGINADGTIKDFARTEKTGLADMLPESKVAGVGNIANNVLNAFMYDAKDTADIRNRLKTLIGEAEAGTEDQSGLNNSADVLTVRDGIKHAMTESDPEVFLKQFDNSEAARTTLYKVAEDLGMEVKDVLSLYSETPAVFEQRIRDAAAKNNGMVAGIDVSAGVDPISTIVQGFTTAKDGKGSPMAWDIRQVQYQISTSLIDSMAKYYTEYYGVKPNSTINTVFDTMKSAQSLLLLGWSPSYFINNVINNAVTAAAEGVLGFMSPQQINQWMTAFGVTPARFDADTNAEFRGQTVQGTGGLEAFSSAASEAKKADQKGLNKVLGDINGVLRKANDKLGVFSTLSGKMETLQGNQLTAVAIQQYWGQRWKRGEGFHLMPDALVETIERQTPGMSNVIYQAIESGLSMDQVRKTLFDTYVKPDAGTVMKSVCADLFRGEAEVYEEILEKSGVMAEIKERMSNCKTEDERAAVMESVKEKLDAYVENLRREDLIQRANNTAAIVESEGLAPVAQMMSEMEMNHQDFWIRQRNEWTAAYTKIQEENMDGPSRRSLLADLVAKQKNEWADLYKQEAATAAGIMKGLGFQNESHAKYIGFMNEKNQNWQNFNDAKSRELARAYERTAAIIAAAENGKRKADRIQINEIWEDFHRNVAELYDQHFEKEQDYQAKMDAAFIEGYEFSTQKSGEQLRQNFQRISDIRQRMHDMQKDAHEQTSKMTAEEKAEFYKEFNPRYNALIREIGNIGDANARIIEETNNNVTQTYEDHAPVQMTPEQTVQATEVKDVADAVREQAMREQKGYLAREGIRNGWIESGRTPAEADLMMAVYDAVADSWAKMNGAYPDEWYSQAAQLKGIAQWLPVGTTTLDLQDSSGKLWQVERILPSDINTDNFRSWFGNSKIVDSTGKPMTVYHGTAEQFEVFRKQKANDKLGRNLGLGLGKDKFYLTTERAAGEAFAKSAESLGRGKSPQVMELYVSVQNPITQSEYESRLSQKYQQYEHSDPRQPGYDYRQRDRAIAALDKEIKAEGYDGIWDQESGQIAVFNSTQIKSIYNGGEWSKNNPNILHQMSLKEQQLQIVQNNNPMHDDIHTGIRSVNDILTLAEAVEQDGNDSAILKEAMRTGMVEVYSSNPITNGVFVTPDYREAKNYAGDGRVYSKTVPINDVAWIDSYEGQYAKVSAPTDYSVLKQTTSEYMQKYGDIIKQHFGNPAFREWFGESKVVDEYGLPLVVHHGTNAQFEVFSKDMLGSNTQAGSAKLGFFFSKGENTAKSYVDSVADIVNGRVLDLMNEESNAHDSATYAIVRGLTTEEVLESYKEAYNRLQQSVSETVFDNMPIMSIEECTEYLSLDEGYQKLTIFGDTNVLNRIADDPSIVTYEGQVMDLYLSIQNPYVYDFKNQERSLGQYKDIVKYAKDNGYDGVIIKNTMDMHSYSVKPEWTDIYVVFEPTQIKSIENDGTFNKINPSILHQQAQEIVKGTFEHTDVGNIIRMLNASDVSTMVHESAHMFRRTLSTPRMTEFATWAGFDSVGDYQTLEARYWANDPTLTDAERSRFEESEEKFARGFEQYLMDGSAPTPGLKAVFKGLRDYLLDIYKKVKLFVAGNNYSEQGEFIFHGKTGDEVLNINAEINGVKLRDIFDRMLTDDVQREPGYTELVRNHRNDLAADRHNMRMKPEALNRRAQIEVTHQILQHFGSMNEAVNALAAYTVPFDIDGMRVDDATLFEALHAAQEDPQMNPWSSVERHEVKGTNTYAYSITEANTGKKYQMQYKVVELGDLIASNEWFGDQLIINENYPGDIQARNRSADVSDVYAHAAALNPGLLIDEQRAIDSGAPIIGEGNMVVESGNGRVLSLKYAQEHFPDQWQNYQEYLRSSVGEYGIDPTQLDSFENPVLIRERLGGDGVAFAEDANTNRNKVMTASENALTDANKVSMNTLAQLDIIPGEGIDTFTTEKNAMPSVEWLRSLPETERARYSTTNRNGDLILSADGKVRFTNALFATLYATPESMEIIRSFSETADSNIQALESALKATLPEMARAEGLIQSGSRAENLSITADVMAAAGLLEEARKAKMNIHEYLAQQTIPGLERWTPTQALLAGFFGDAKNNVRMLKDFFNAYGEEVFRSGDPNQISLFGDSKTREQMINDSLDAAINKKRDQGQVASDKQPAGLKQSVLDSGEKWTSKFAKILDENLQRTFDDGMSVPLDQADGVFLQGDVDTRYETRIQRWLRDFSNEKNLSADQYLYAWDYFEWWVNGSEGEAPKGNPVWETEIQNMVINQFVEENSTSVKELQRRKKQGAEIDPGSVPASGEFVKRVYGFEHGFWNVAGNVYKDGTLVAYLPEELDKMQRTIEVDGQSYKVLGVDLNNPEGLVYFDPVLEITRTVIAGKPEGFEEPRNPFAFMRPAHQGSTPQTMPVADGYAEIKTKYLDPALAKFGEEYQKADQDARTAKMSGLDLQTRAMIEQWLDQDVSEDMRLEKYRAMKYSDTKKDAAMLNYNQRYGFDPILTMLSPYQFWYTRSMWKWAKRMIDKPALGNAYQRMQEYEDKNRQENIPSRIAGKWRIPMPFLPDWMGGSYYIDLNSQLFPFAQFGESYSSNMNAATLNARAEAILNDLADAGQISTEQMQEALQKKSGAVWENAYAQAEVEVGRNDQLQTLADQFISPNIFVSWFQKKKEGEDPGTLSGTRTGNAIKALTSDIPLVSSLGSVIGDAMTLPEKALRKLYGLDYNEFGQLGDQYIRKQISQMCADGEITWREALNAMNEKSGTIWDMAADRQRKEAMIKVPGFAGAQAVKDMVTGNASLGETLGAMAVSALGGGSIYPTGEKELREMKASKDQAYLMKAAGETDAVNRWYDENPDYVTRQATYIEDPEELLKFTLYNQITTNYYNQPYAQQQAIMNQMEPEFYYALFNKETKNYKGVSIEKLAEWNAALGGKNPSVGSIDVQGVEKVMQLSQPVIDVVTQHDEYKDQMFPGISVIQNGYYNLPKDQRKAYLNYFPQLSEYWDWNRQYKNDHPDYVRWENERTATYNERTMYESYAAMSERTQKELEYAKATGRQMSDTAQYELQRLYQKYANTNFTSYKDYIKQLQDYE